MIPKVSNSIESTGAEMYKVCSVIVGIALFLPLWVLAQPSPNSAAGMLAAMKGKSRPLLVFYPQAPGERPIGRQLQSQRTLLSGHEKELSDRSVALIYVPRDRGVVEDITMSKWHAFRDQFHVVDREFTVVLVGKDGGEKFRSHEPVTIEKLDALIDAMPMRQQEVGDGQHAK